MNFVLDLRAASKSGAVVPARLTHGKLEDLQFAGSVTFLLHGFNVDREKGTDSLLRFAGLLPPSASASVAALWPGDSHAGGLGYSFERNDADDSAAELAKFILDNLRARPRISFVAHSLGCRVTLQTVRALVAAGYPVDQVCLMAAAVDDDALASSEVYRSAAKGVSRIAVLHSRKDKVLAAAYPMGDWLQAFVFWSEVSGAALGYRGPRARHRPAEAIPTNVLAAEIDKKRGVGHGDYLPDNPPNTEQRSAAAYAADVVRGFSLPVYP